MANIQKHDGNHNVAFFILNFTNKEFFRVDGDIEWVAPFYNRLDTRLAPPPPHITINGQPYCPDMPVTCTQIAQDNRVVCIFVYGEPSDDHQFQVALNRLLDDGSDNPED
jgi:hypothetical protein